MEHEYDLDGRTVVPGAAPAGLLTLVVGAERPGSAARRDLWGQLLRGRIVRGGPTGAGMGAPGRTRTRRELYVRAQELDIAGRSLMTKAELEVAVTARERQPSIHGLTRAQLLDIAKVLKIVGRHAMSKDQLQTAVDTHHQQHSLTQTPPAPDTADDSGHEADDSAGQAWLVAVDAHGDVTVADGAGDWMVIDIGHTQPAGGGRGL